MKKHLRLLLPPLVILQVFALMVATEKPAHAYVDPGSGLLVFQVLGSMVAGAVYFLRYRIKKLFGFKTEEPGSKPENPPSGVQ